MARFCGRSGKKTETDFLKDWQQKLDQFLQFNDRNVLENHGCISRQQANEKAYIEYDVYSEQQRKLMEKQGEQDIAALLQWTSKGKQ